LSVKQGVNGSVLDDLRLSGSLKAVFPRPVAQGLDSVLVNTAGGITGGDRFDISGAAAAGTSLNLTTQAAERAYRAQPGETGRLSSTLRAAEKARLHWLPQETILFDGCALNRSMRVDLAASASLLMVEPVVFGRAAMGERLNTAQFRDRIEIWREGRLIFLDQLALEGDVATQLSRPFAAPAAGAMALVVLIGPQAQAALPSARRMLPEFAAASLIGEDILVIRCLAGDSYDLRTTLVPLLKHLSKSDLPKCWMI